MLHSRTSARLVDRRLLPSIPFSQCLNASLPSEDGGKSVVDDDDLVGPVIVVVEGLGVVLNPRHFVPLCSYLFMSFLSVVTHQC